MWLESKVALALEASSRKFLFYSLENEEPWKVLKAEKNQTMDKEKGRIR